MTSTMLPEGTYKARATEAVLAKAGTGTEQIAVGIEFLEGEAAGHFRTWYGYFTEGTFERTIESLRTMGWTGNDLADLAGIGSTEFYAVIGYEADQDGVVRERVKWINGTGGVAVKERMDPTEARAFANRMRGAIVAHASGQKGARPTAAPSARPQPSSSSNTRAPARAQQAAPAVEDSDDIPF